MPRYFIEVSYQGTNYSGFQSQLNANTIQAEVEKAMRVLLRIPVTGGPDDFKLTGSSRTDAGVHAVQNFFHFDILQPSLLKEKGHFVYKMNAILPNDIAIKNLYEVKENYHSRFDAVSREYSYFIYQQKNPFLNNVAYYFPYKLDLESLQQAATIVKEYNDFTSFSKRNTQAKTFNCQILTSEWIEKNECLIYNVEANRFLRGMVRALTATMLMVGRNKLSLNDFRVIIEKKDCTKANFAAPPHGLFLNAVKYPGEYFTR